MEKIKAVQVQVANTLGVETLQMDKYFVRQKNIIKWNIGDRVMYQSFAERNHALSPLWLGLAYIIDKASPTVHVTEINRNKRKIKKMVPFITVKRMEEYQLKVQVYIISCFFIAALSMRLTEGIWGICTMTWQQKGGGGC